MYISNLTLHGFKSFAKKVSLQFGEGIVAIVGPNGCGKTNIVDAIRWVLGEQKHSVLRSGRMEDVIFSGSDSLKPLSVCEVTLTVNNKGRLPIEYQEVEIGRRVFRSGESEYFLNRTPCRLKDILDLLVDTGMGADAYSVIELKMIEQILSETAGDRKRMFEEAAGINKYKLQRRTALRKFEATRADLERVNDIITEVDTKVRSLALQLKRFKRHAKLTDTLREKEIALAVLQLQELTGKTAPIRKRIEEYQHLKSSTSTNTSLHEQELEQLQQVYKEQQVELENLRQEVAELEQQRDTQRNEVLIAMEQNRSAKATLDRLANEEQSNITKVGQLTDHVRDYEQELTSLDPILEEKLRQYQEQKEAYEQEEQAYTDAQAEVERMQNRRWEERKKLSELQARMERTEAQIRDREERVRQLEAKKQDLEAVQEQNAGEQKNLEARIHEHRSRLETMKHQVEVMEQELTRLQTSRHELTLKHHGTIAQVESLESQLQFYRELVETGEGYPDGVRFVLNQLSQFPGIFGTVADLFQVAETYQAALESALGSLAHCLVARDRVAALKTLARVREAQGGELAIIPLKEIGQLQRQPRTLPKESQILARASEIVETPKNIHPLVQYLLDNVLVVKDLQAALGKENLAGWDLVDKKGAFSGTNFILKHQEASKQGSMLGRQKKIEQLNGEIEQLVAQVQKTKLDLDNLEATIHSREEELDQQSSLVESNIEKISQLETEAIRNHYNQSKTLEAIQEVTHEIAENRKTLHQLTDALNRLVPKVKNRKTVVDNITEKLTETQARLKAVQRQREVFHRQVQDLRIELLNLENQRDNLHFQKRVAEENITELLERQKKIKEERRGCHAKMKSLGKKITSGEQAVAKINARLQKQRSIVGLRQEASRETFRSIEALQRNIRDEQHRQEELLEELKAQELHLVEYEQQMTAIQERIQEKYQQAVSTDLPVEGTVDGLSLQVERLRRSIENIGPINMAVKDEYEEEVERLNLLNSQQDDLVAAEANLRETIQKIDRVARKQFQDTFYQIKGNFEKLFKLFFEGGQASLSLTGDPDPLEADVEIMARPPGKRNQSLRMLSAGEKALTAIALLFAIYQVKPSPYCILDEVDAPLDDVNVRKFTKVLKQFTDNTQFIVVTHNKLTMEAANYLYGVTMEQKGVSQLVSVKFDA